VAIDPISLNQATEGPLRSTNYCENADANFHLGMALIMRGEVTPEAIACLKFAAPKDARARKALVLVEECVWPEAGR
jgi:hypothetical protein